MLFKVLGAVLFGKRFTGTVTGYELCRTYRSVEYYRYMVEVNINGNIRKFISAEAFGAYDGRKPQKHLNCEVTVYCRPDSGICTLYSPADMLVFLSAGLFIVVLILMLVV